MFALIWVILLFADKGSGTTTQGKSFSSAEPQSTEAPYSVSISVGPTTQETTTRITPGKNSKKLRLSGNAVVKKGDTLNLTCSADDFPASSISWIKPDSNKEIVNKTSNGSASLIISNVTAEHYGQYICIATCLNETFTEIINVTYPSSAFGVVPRILNTSKCERQSEVLTCVCTTEGFPSPTIKWPHLENHTVYSVTTTVSSTTVTSTITVSLKHSHDTTIECVSNNSFGAANLSITTESQRNNLFQKLLTIVQEPKVVVAALTGFLIGIILQTIILCVVTKSCRKKRKTSENLSENLEMVSTEAVPMMDADQAAVYDGIHEPEAAEGEADSAGQSAPDGDLAPKEVEYSNINFSAMKTRNPEEAEKTQDTTDTEYAEIKTEGKRRENSQEDSEKLEEMEVMTGEDNDTKKTEEEGDEGVALYSSVDEIMG